MIAVAYLKVTFTDAVKPSEANAEAERCVIVLLEQNTINPEAIADVEVVEK